jgi:hypothetical protein
MIIILSCCLTLYSTGSADENGHNLWEKNGKLIQDLANYEIDNTSLITLCLDNIRDQTLETRLLKLKDECEDNIEILSRLIKQYGRTPPTYPNVTKGFLMEGYAIMKGGLTDAGALRTLYSNQQIILKAFEKALGSPLPKEEKEIIKKIYSQKVKSLHMIEDFIGRFP